MNGHFFGELLNPPPRRAPAPGPVGLKADWRDMVLVHFRFDPADLQPHVPLPLHLFNGVAYVTLVYFRLENMRPNGTGALGRLALKPISDHPFLNVRTYVRGPAGVGIFFLREWITNRLSCRLGPALYGLPYRHAEFHLGPKTAERRERIVRCSAEAKALTITYSTPKAPAQRPERASLGSYLVDNYTAYTYHRNILRTFHVRHAAWSLTKLDSVQVESDLVVAEFPWFARGECVGGHASEGFREVFMSRPTVVERADRHVKSVAFPPSFGPDANAKNRSPLFPSTANHPESS